MIKLFLAGFMSEYTLSSYNGQGRLGTAVMFEPHLRVLEHGWRIPELFVTFDALEVPVQHKKHSE